MTYYLFLFPPRYFLHMVLATSTMFVDIILFKIFQKLSGYIFYFLMACRCSRGRPTSMWSTYARSSQLWRHSSTPTSPGREPSTFQSRWATFNVRRPRVRISARHPSGGPLPQRTAMRKLERNSTNVMNECVVYEYINEKSGFVPPNLKKTFCGRYVIV